MNKRVVITGLGVVAPNGIGINDFNHALKNGISGICNIPEMKNLNFQCTVGGVPDISKPEHIELVEKYQIHDADLGIKYAVLAGLEAWQNAGLTIPEIDCDNYYPDYGAIIGTCCSGQEIIARKLYPIVKSGNPRKLGSKIIEYLMPSGPVSVLAGILALGNLTTSNSSACATGSEAIAFAYERIKSGKAKLMIAGGTDPFAPFSWAGFDAMRVLARGFNKTPKQASRPMSQSANGFVPSAGAGIIVLEDFENAKNRNATIYAEIIGSATNSGGQRKGGSMTLPNSESVVNCIEQALQSANIKGDQIDLICGHLTGTKADVIEIRNWIKALEIENTYPYLNSLKSMTGHLIGAAGAVETVACVLQLFNNYVHPSINCEDLNPEIGKLYPVEKIPNKCINDAVLNYAIKASFGFGDVNSCIILKKTD